MQPIQEIASFAFGSNNPAKASPLSGRVSKVAKSERSGMDSAKASLLQPMIRRPDGSRIAGLNWSFQAN